tara:strand:- start:2895 stop:3206 length:312 start_codon:yes stop_codon:yes gene_type:complete
MLQAIAPAFRDIEAAVGIIDRLPEPRPEAAKPDAARSHRERWRLPAISRGAAAACLLVVLAMPCLTAGGRAHAGGLSHRYRRASGRRSRRRIDRAAFSVTYVE